jgi:hypothetical protein
MSEAAAIQNKNNFGVPRALRLSDGLNSSLWWLKRNESSWHYIYRDISESKNGIFVSLEFDSRGGVSHEVRNQEEERCND